jgi:hypothetical protein
MLEDYADIPLRTTANKNVAEDINQLMSNLKAKYLAPSSTLTLTKNSSRRLILNPSADCDVVLPTTGITIKDDFIIYNVGYKVLTLKSSALSVVGKLHNGSHVLSAPKQDAPTIGSHWGNSFSHKKKIYRATAVSGMDVLGVFTNGTLTVTASDTGFTWSEADVTLQALDDGNNYWEACFAVQGGYSPEITDGTVTFAFSGCTMGPIGYYPGTNLYYPSASTYIYSGTPAYFVISGPASIGSCIGSIRGYLTGKPSWAD